MRESARELGPSSLLAQELTPRRQLKVVPVAGRNDSRDLGLLGLFDRTDRSHVLLGGLGRIDQEERPFGRAAALIWGGWRGGGGKGGGGGGGGREERSQKMKKK